ncbi:MAG TPA: aminotransferase class V-fold PLP-dependent enzyme, partial [Candidatus Bathyarchaeia archaeon]|nr:aminotransferase class V-fold PLP-dependent enzyme [Candidatus Bathyarchaeia archaeon]
MSTPRKIYLDHAAGKPVDHRALEAMLPHVKSSYGNPSSLHTFGQEARRALDEARVRVAELIHSE